MARITDTPAPQGLPRAQEGLQPASRPTTDDVGLLLSQAESSAIEIASGRLLAGRPPAWTLPRRPPMRSPGAKRPLRRGFNRMPELADQTCTAKTYHSNATSAVVSTIRCVRRSEMDILQATQM